jgi:hypothetical protein
MKKSQSPFVEKGGYRFNRRIFLVAAIFLNFFMLVLILTLRTHTAWYFECAAESPQPCHNPFYKEGEFERTFCTLEGEDEKFCEPMLITPGTGLGDPPTFFMRHEFAFAFLPILAAFLANHFIYNRRYGLWKKLFSKP